MSDLYTRLFGAHLFPLLDRANGTRIVPQLERLLAGERLEPAELLRRQEEKLARAVAWMRDASPFYRSFVAASAPGPVSRYAALSGLPILTKADIATAGDRFPVPAWQGRSLVSRTSGSTGQPMTFYRTPLQESRFWALRFRFWRWAGYRPGDPYLEINLNPRTGWKKQLQDRLFRCSYLTFNTDNQDSLRIVRRLEKSRIPYLNGFSSSLYALARAMLDRGIPNPGVVGITATGDTLYPLYRETIEAAFGVRVLDYYGAGGEGLHVASQCLESGGRYHVHPENAVVEVLGEEGPVAPGTPGRIVVTQLENEAMPLVRYDLEDVAVPAAPGELCSCGRTLPLLEGIEGRAADLVVTPDGGLLVPHFFVVLFKNLQHVRRFQVVQRRPESLSVRLVATPVATRSARAGVEEVVRAAVSAATRGGVATEFEWVDEIPLSGAGKRRWVISEVSRPGLAPPVPAAAASPEARR